MKKGWQKLQELLRKENLDYLLIDSSPNRFYLTGFTGSFGYVLIPEKGTPFLIVDSRYTLQAKKQSLDFKVTTFQSFNKDFWLPFVAKNKGSWLGFDSSISHERLLNLRKNSKNLNLIPTKGLVESLRAIKSEAEIKTIKKALKISDQAFSNILKKIKPGMSEKEVAWELEKEMRSLGADRSAWDPQIVATGKNSALPHHGHSKTKIKEGDMIQFDFGCVLDGYHTDTSRMVFIGEPNIKQKQAYDLLLRAQMLGISLVKPGVKTCEIDKKVREFLEGKTKGIYNHGLGHGVGLEIHESPNVSINSKDILHEGQVITIEPGIYIEGWGGVRLEDMVLVTSNGYQVLTRATKKLTQVIV